MRANRSSHGHLVPLRADVKRLRKGFLSVFVSLLKAYRSHIILPVSGHGPSVMASHSRDHSHTHAHSTQHSTQHSSQHSSQLSSQHSTQHSTQHSSQLSSQLSTQLSPDLLCSPFRALSAPSAIGDAASAGPVGVPAVADTELPRAVACAADVSAAPITDAALLFRRVSDESDPQLFHNEEFLEDVSPDYQVAVSCELCGAVRCAV